jgi:hypothetical protein
MPTELSRRAELWIHTRTGAPIVFESRAEQVGPVPIMVLGSLLSARAWIEGHYTGVQWDSERSGTALVGRLAADLSLATLRPRRRARRIAFQSEDFREYRPEIVMDERGPVVLVLCEELDPESGRWEPFVSTVWRSR